MPIMNKAIAIIIILELQGFSSFLTSFPRVLHSKSFKILPIPFANATFSLLSPPSQQEIHVAVRVLKYYQSYLCSLLSKYFPS